MAATQVGKNGLIHLMGPLRAHLGLAPGETVVLFILRDGRVMLETQTIAAQRRRTRFEEDADEREFTCAITSAGDIRLPEGIRRQLGVSEGNPLTLRLLRDGRVHVERAFAVRRQDNPPMRAPGAVTALGVGVEHDVRDRNPAKNFSKVP